MELELTALDRSIIEQIDRSRALNHAVTARQLGSELGLHNSYISRRLHALREAGLVDFNEKVPGAIWVVGTIEVRPDETGELVPLAVRATRPSSVGPARPIRLGVHREKVEAAAAAGDAVKQAIAEQRRASLAKARAAKAAKKNATAPSSE